MCFFSQDQLVTTPVKCHVPGKLIRLSVTHCLLGAVLTLAHSTQHETGFQTPHTKAGVLHKPHYLYKQFTHSEHFYMRTQPISKFPEAYYGPVSQAGLSKDRVSGLLCFLFPAQLPNPAFGDQNVMLFISRPCHAKCVQRHVHACIYTMHGASTTRLC